MNYNNIQPRILVGKPELTQILNLINLQFNRNYIIQNIHDYI